jgi:hypothetical protein
MKYSKPEIIGLGTTVAAVRQQIGKVPNTNADSQTHSLPPSMYQFTVNAYEADE